MNTYRIITSESRWDDKRILYGAEIWVEGITVRGHKDFKEVVFEAEDNTVAEKVFEFYVKELENTKGKWSASLQKVRVDGGLVCRLRTLRTVISHR